VNAGVIACAKEIDYFVRAQTRSRRKFHKVSLAEPAINEPPVRTPVSERIGPR
jgi:hypothetical protein